MGNNYEFFFDFAVSNARAKTARHINKKCKWFEEDIDLWQSSCGYRSKLFDPKWIKCPYCGKDIDQDVKNGVPVAESKKYVFSLLLEEFELTEDDILPLLFFYEAAAKNKNPSLNIAVSSAQLLLNYYNNYLNWYRNVWSRKRCDDEKDYQRNTSILRDFTARRNELRSALNSRNLPELITAVDNGINQWHIDYPVIEHLGFDLEEKSDIIGKIYNILEKLGRLPKSSPYL